jgi:hypothetical protein
LANKLALECKKAGQKEKAMRYLTDIKAMKAQVAKISGYNTILMKNMMNLDSVGIDNEMADVFGQTVN